MKIIKNPNLGIPYYLILMVLFFCSTSKSIYGQSISINSTFNSNTTVYTFSPSETIYSFTFTGSSTLNSSSSSVRVILVDNSSVEHLVYESYPLLHGIGTNTITSFGEETKYMNGTNVGYVKVEISDASITINTIERTNTPISGVANLRTSYLSNLTQNKVDGINQTLQQSGALWVAAVTDVSQLSYQVKKNSLPFLNSPRWYGFEYYKAGIFDASGGIYYDPSPNIVKRFDWSDRHGVNWNTGIKNQVQSPYCTAFSSLATLESLINLYYNNPNIDKDLSEQALSSCGTFCNWDKYWCSIKDNGVTEEQMYPFNQSAISYEPCLYPTQNWSDYLWKVTGYKTYYNGNGGSSYYVPNEVQLKSDIINYGPVAFGLNIPGTAVGHDMSLVGFDVVEPNKILQIMQSNYNINGQNFPVNSPYLGKVYWIFKNSWGVNLNNGYTGYACVFIDLTYDSPNTMVSYTQVNTPIIQPSTSSYQVQCTDNDNDGYYYWGIGSKPANCGGTNPQDCDDSNPYLIGYNSKYECIFDCNNFTYNSIPLEITSDLVIGDAEYTQDIIIKSPAIVSIQGKVNMQSDAKIVVEKGAKLIIDGGEITNPCGQLWGGIEVQGDYNKPQYPETNQGVVEVINYGKISMANIAIQTKTAPRCATPPGQYIGGGIVKADKAIFENNRKSIFLRPFQNYIILNGNRKNLPDRSYIKNSNFEINDDFLSTLSFFDNFIFLNGINNIALYGNSYKNINTTSSIMQNYAYRGIAIDAIESSFRLKPSYTSSLNPTIVNNSVMDGLLYGVKVFNTNPDKVVRITENIFNNNYRGIYLNKTYSSVLTKNKFYVPNIQLTPSIDRPYGLYLDESQSFKVEENDFYTTNPSGNANQTYGIIINNTKANNNEIYNNTFDDFYVALQPELQNKGTDITTMKGLYLICNSIDNSNIDIRPVGKTAFPNTPNIGIATFHLLSEQNSGTGIDYYPSGNKFSNRSSGYDIDNNDAGAFNYGHEQNTATERYEPTYKINVSPSPFNWAGKPRCESKIIDNLTIADQYNGLSIAFTKVLSSKLILDIWRNGGIDNLEEEVRLTLPWEAYAEFNTLLQESPYLSEEVLIEFVNNPVFSSLMVKLLLVANPQASRSEEVMNTVYKRIPALPESYIEEILAEEGTYSQLEQLEGEAAADYHLFEIITDNIIRSYRRDTINDWANDSLIAILSRQPDLYGQYELAATYMQLKDYESMDAVLNSVASTFDLAEDQQAEYENYLTTLAIAKDMNDNEKYYKGLSESQRSTLMGILENYPNNKALALVLLKRDNPNFVYQELILDPPSKELRKINPKSNITEDSHKMNIFPNPTTDYFTIEYNTSDLKYNKLLLVLHDAVGRVVLEKQLQGGNGEELINLGVLSPGIYNVMLFADNLIIDNKKLTVTK